MPLSLVTAILGGILTGLGSGIVAIMLMTEIANYTGAAELLRVLEPVGTWIDPAPHQIWQAPS